MKGLARLQLPAEILFRYTHSHPQHIMLGTFNLRGKASGIYEGKSQNFASRFPCILTNHSHKGMLLMAGDTSFGAHIDPAMPYGASVHGSLSCPGAGKGYYLTVFPWKLHTGAHNLFQIHLIGAVISDPYAPCQCIQASENTVGKRDRKSQNLITKIDLQSPDILLISEGCRKSRDTGFSVKYTVSAIDELTAGKTVLIPYLQ